MKVAIIVINKNTNKICESLNILSIMQSFFTAKSISIISTLTINNKSQNIIETFNYINNSDADKIFIVSETNDFLNIKSIYASFCQSELIENAFAKNALISLAKKFNTTVTKRILQEANLPANARALKCNLCLNVGFIDEVNGKEWYLLPKGKKELIQILETTVMPYIETEFRKTHFAVTVRAFGISENEVKNMLTDIIGTYKDLEIDIQKDGLEITLFIKYTDQTPKVIVDNVTAIIYERLNPYILSDLNLDVKNLCLELLKIYNKKLSICETVTNGFILNRFFEIDKDVSNCIDNGIIIPNTKSLSNLLNLSPEFISTDTSYSDLAYEIAAKILEKNNCDYVAAVTGSITYIGSYCKANICTAVGDKNAIHIFNNEFELEKSEAFKQIDQIVTYYIIKKIKNL